MSDDKATFLYDPLNPLARILGESSEMGSTSNLYVKKKPTKAAIVAVMRDWGALRIRLPENARQVPQLVLRRHRVVGAVQFGFELGTGVRTYLTSTSPYVLALFVATQIDQPLRAGLVGAMFGMGRGLMVLARRLSADPEAWDRRMDRSVGRLRITSSLLVLMTLAFMSFNPVWLDAI